MALSTKSTLPVRFHSVSSDSRMRTGLAPSREEASAPDRIRRL